MQKTIFKVSEMDCPSEENLIRLKLSEISEIKNMEFDIPNRILTIYHFTDFDKIRKVLAQLKFGEKHIETTTVENVEFEEHTQQRKLLWSVLLINFGFFIIESTTGFFSKSMGLVADSLDMLADSFVYGISLLAVGGSVSKKKNIAKIAGYSQILLAVLGFVEVLRRFVGEEETPVFSTMIGVSILALIANGICLFLLQKSKSQDAHMQASMIFTSNDVVINLGVIIAGGLVYWLESNKPDLIIGTIVFIIVLRGAKKILTL
ncbi:MAG TPA: cation transporter [Phaeodactylibacter sp.]|nr:cation transporter [Phaeodactylibacter sp.]